MPTPINKKGNSNFIVQGTHSKTLFVVADNFADKRFLNLISLNKDIPNRVEKISTVNDPSEYSRVGFNLGLIQLVNI